MKGLNKKIKEYSTANLTLGVGTMIGASMKAKSPSVSTEGFSTAAGFMPIIGTTMMGGHALQSVKGLSKKKKGGTF